MISLKLDGIKEVKGKFKDLQINQFPSALRNTLNKLAKEVNEAEISTMKKVFDRPTPYTLKSTFIKYASSKNLSSFVGFRDFAGKGTPAEKYIAPQVFGGKRQLKRFESALRRKGILPAGMFAVPGPGAKLDGYGNMDRGQIVQLMSYFNAFGEQGYRANMTGKRRGMMAKGTKKAGSSVVYFVAGSGGRASHLHPGIYARHGFVFGSALKPIILFVKAPAYQKRFRFEEVAQKVCDSRYRLILEAEIGKAIQKAKP